MKTKRVHKLLALLLALMMTFSLLPTVTWATEKEEEEYVFQGSGTETDPYLIGAEGAGNKGQRRLGHRRTVLQADRRH